MGFRFDIVTGSSSPIYKQIMDRIRLALLEGTLCPGDRLPSVRHLAEELVVNPNTVARAFNDLVKEGTLESRHGKGVFVSERRQVFTKTERVRRLEPLLEAFLNEARMLDFSPKEIHDVIDRRLKGLTPKSSKPLKQ